MLKQKQNTMLMGIVSPQNRGIMNMTERKGTEPTKSSQVKFKEVKMYCTICLKYPEMAGGMAN